MTDNLRDLSGCADRTSAQSDLHNRIAAALICELNDQCGDCWRRGDERDGCNCAYPKGHPIHD